MALEVGRLVARIDIEGSFEQKIAAAKTAMEDAAKSAARFDDALGKAGESGKRLDVPAKAKDSLDKAATSASKLDEGLSKAAASGKKMDVSDSAKRKLEDTATSAGKTAGSLDKASASGKNMRVSDQPKQKLAETASFADQLDAKLGHVGLSLAKLKTAGTGLAIGATLFAGLDRVKAIDTAQGKLRGLGHEAASVTEIMNSATESVTGTAYGLGDAATIAANAVAAGIQPGKDLTKYLTMTADASAIAGVSLGEMGRILNQVQTGQSAYAGDLSQLADRGIPIYQWLADEAGVAASEIKKMASTGQISSEMLFSAIQKNIGGAAQEMGGTLTGSLANVGAAFGRLGASAIDPFKDDIMAASEGAQKFAGALSGVVGPAAGVAASALSGVAKVIGVIPTPIIAATGALIALQKTGLGDTLALKAMYAGDAIKNFGSSMGGINGIAGTMKSGLKGVVDMLGGPLMIGLAGATVAVTDIIGSIQRASAAQDAISESAARAATAHDDLTAALIASNGAMSDSAVAVAQSLIEESITSTSAAAEQASGMFAGLGNWIDNTSLGYDGMKDAINGSVSAMDRSRLEGRVNEMQLDALREAAGSLGISMDDVSKVVQEGGPRWELLRAAIAAIGPEGEDMARKLDQGKAAVDAIVDSATDAEVASMALAEAFRVMADESATAEDKTNALKAALDTLAGKQMSVDEAMFNYYETIDKVSDATTKMADATGLAAIRLEDGSLAFDHTSERSNMLRDSFMSMKDATLQVAGTGENMAPIWAANQAEMEKLAAATGFTTDELWQLAEATTGFSQKKIEATVALHNGGAVMAELGIISQALTEAEKGATIRVENIGDDALAYLKELEWQAERIEGTTDITVVAKTAEAQKELQATIQSASELDGIEADIQFKSNVGDVGTSIMGLLPQIDAVDGKTATAVLNANKSDADGKIAAIFAELAALDEAESNPALGLVIDDFLAGRDISHAELDALHSRVVDPQARLLIEQLLNESSRANADLDNTARPRTATITPQLAPGSLGSIQSMLNGMSFSVPVTALPSLPAAHGGFLPTSSWSFADGGMTPNGSLPNNARIERPHGSRGIVQWAEAETGGEAFIPLAPSKRKRSLDIWRETGRRLGVFADGGMLPAGDGTRGDMGGVLAPLFGKFADGGITASGLVNLAKGVEGAPYVWGGVNWGDCSGAVSALANYVSGRSPFGSRFATGNEGQALAERGFKSGRGKKGDLQIGWFSGGPYGGHTSATLPNGTNFEMGGGRGNGQYGGSAAGANSGQYTNHAHFPAENFADANSSTLGGAADTRTPREKNIDAIVAEGQRRNLSDDDIMTALMVAEQESGTRVLANPADAASMGMANEGVGYDHDSTGIFQQRNNGAWGTLEDRMDPTKSSAMFYDELEKIQGRENMRKTEVAQKVQRSAYPEAYAKHEAKASEMLSASKSRISSLGSSSGAGGSGEGQRVYVTNWPAGGFSGGSSGGGGGGSSAGGGDAASIVKEGSLADLLLRAAGQDPDSLFPTTVSGKEKRFDDTKLLEKEGDIEAAKEQARIAELKLEELKNKTNAKGERVAPSESALAAAELKVQEAHRKIAKLEHDLRELQRKANEVTDHNRAIGVDVENFADGGFHGLENHSAQITPGGSWRVWGEPETGGEAYIPLASHKRARSTAILAETARRMGYSLGAGVNLVGSVLTGNGLDTGWGGPSLDDIGIDTGGLRDALSPGVTAEAERAGQQIAAILQNLGATVDQQVEGTLSQVNDGKAQLRQQYSRAMI